MATIINEYGQVLDQFMCEGKTMAELAVGLRRLRDNFQRLRLEVRGGRMNAGARRTACAAATAAPAAAARHCCPSWSLLPASPLSLPVPFPSRLRTPHYAPPHLPPSPLQLRTAP